MKIAVLGTGVVGQRLGFGFISKGHEVKMGSRDAKNQSMASWIASNGNNASSGTFADAAAFGEVIVLATLGSPTQEAVTMAGPDNFTGKVVIDATNPLAFRDDGPPELFVGWNDSLGEQVQRWLPKARVVKCFNTVGNAHFVQPNFPGGPPDMFIAGNDEAAKATVTALLEDFGWPAIDIGGIEGARLLEPMCILWVIYGIRSGAWNHAFKMLRK
jgi:predicted dinucleotide-binding enzyme